MKVGWGLEKQEESVDGGKEKGANEFRACTGTLSTVLAENEVAYIRNNLVGRLR